MTDSDYLELVKVLKLLEKASKNREENVFLEEAKKILIEVLKRN